MRLARKAKLGYDAAKDDSDSDWSESGQPSRRCGPTRSCCCLLFCCIVLAAPVASFYFWLYAESVVADEVEQVGEDVLGVETSVNSVHLTAFSKSSIESLVIASPPGYEGEFLSMREGEFSVGLLSMVEGPLQLAPVEIESISASVFKVQWEQDVTGKSNAAVILDHIQKTVPLPNMSQDLVHQLTSRMVLDNFELKGIDAEVSLHPLTDLTGTLSYHIDEVRVTDVGKRRDGVYLWELFAVLAHAVICAAIEAAPQNLRENMVKSAGHMLHSDLDFGGMFLLNGTGHWVDIFTPVVSSSAIVGEVVSGISAIDEALRTGIHMAAVGAESMGVADEGANQTTKSQLNATETYVKTGIHAAALAAETALQAVGTGKDDQAAQ